MGNCNNTGICLSCNPHSQGRDKDSEMFNSQLTGPSSRYPSTDRRNSNKPSQEALSCKQATEKNTNQTGVSTQSGTSFMQFIGFGGSPIDPKKKEANRESALQKWQIAFIQESDSEQSNLNDQENNSQKSSKSEPKSNENKKQASFEKSVNGVSRSKSEQNLKGNSYKGSEHDLMSVKLDNQEYQEVEDQSQKLNQLPKKMKKELNHRRQMILKALIDQDNDSDDAGNDASDEEIQPRHMVQKHGLKKKKTEAELGKDRNMVNILNNVHNRRFLENLFEENNQYVPPPANMLEELKNELGLNDEQSQILAHYISQTEGLTDENSGRNFRPKFGNIAGDSSINISGIRSRAYSNVFKNPEGLGLKGEYDFSDPESLGLSGIEDMQSVHRLKHVIMNLQSAYNTQTDLEWGSAFEGNNNILESDFDSDIKSLMKIKSHMRQQNNLRIDPILIKGSVSIDNSFSLQENIQGDGEKSKNDDNLDKTIENIKTITVIEEEPTTPLRITEKQKSSQRLASKINTPEQPEDQQKTENVQQEVTMKEYQFGTLLQNLESTTQEHSIQTQKQKSDKNLMNSKLIGSPKTLAKEQKQANHEKQKCWRIPIKPSLFNTQQTIQKKQAFIDDPVNTIDFQETQGSQDLDGPFATRRDSSTKHNFKRGAHAKKKPKKAKVKPLADLNILQQLDLLKQHEKDISDENMSLKIRKNSAESINAQEFEQFNSFKIRKQSADLISLEGLKKDTSKELDQQFAHIDLLEQDKQ